MERSGRQDPHSFCLGPRYTPSDSGLSSGRPQGQNPYAQFRSQETKDPRLHVYQKMGGKGKLDIPPQKTPLWQVDYFKLKTRLKDSGRPSFP